MGIIGTLTDREYQKFADVDNKPAVRVSDPNLNEVFGTSSVRSSDGINIAPLKKLIDNMDDVTGWATQGQASGLTSSTTHVEGTHSLSFDKDGVSGTTGYIEKTIDSIDLSTFQTHAILHCHAYLSSATNITNLFLRIGKDSSNYFQYDFGNVVTGWNDLDAIMSARTSQTGTGSNSEAITYVACGITTANNGTTLNDILFDAIYAKRMLEVLSFGAEAVDLATRIRIQDNNTGRLAEVNSSAQLEVSANQSGEFNVSNLNSLITSSFDSINLIYAGSNLVTASYLTGGTGGSTVATLSLGYSGNTLTSVAKT